MAKQDGQRRRAPYVGRLVAAAVGVLLVAGCSSTAPQATSDAGAPSPVAHVSDTAVSDTAAVGTIRRPASPTGPVPTVSGPVTGGEKGNPYASQPGSLLTGHGYVEEEFFLAGQATSYTATGTWGEDGHWQITPGTTAGYTTRALVRRPSSPDKFNGTVLVEWMNVSSLFDIPVDFGYLSTELLDQGFIYVGVSVQKIGHENTKQSDPTRYAALEHPGDDYSYDIFTQAGRAVLANALFPSSYSVRKILADGESQSAGRMTTYINAVQPVADVYDGFLVHSRSSRVTPIAAGQAAPPAGLIRTDLRSPTLVFLTETDVTGNLAAKQDDSDTYRRWEVAGSAHVDNYDMSILGATDPAMPAAPGKACVQPINMADEWVVMNAALHHLAAWVGGGPPPPKGDRMQVDANNTYVTDEHGNAKGGIRLPDVDVPVAVNKGQGNDPGWCRLFGSTTPFDPSTLASLYPTHEAYVQAYDAAVDRLRDQGFVLDRDAATVKQKAQAAKIPS